MTLHNDLRDHVAARLNAYGWRGWHPYDAYIERKPSVDSPQRADIIAYDTHSWRPVVVVEVKPALRTAVDVSESVRQVQRYVTWLRYESPRAKVFPLVVASEISAAVDARPWVTDALVWSAETFDRICDGVKLEEAADLFFDRRLRPDEFGLQPVTSHPRTWPVAS